MAKSDFAKIEELLVEQFWTDQMYRKKTDFNDIETIFRENDYNVM